MCVCAYVRICVGIYMYVSIFACVCVSVRVHLCLRSNKVLFKHWIQRTAGSAPTHSVKTVSCIAVSHTDPTSRTPQTVFIYSLQLLPHPDHRSAQWSSDYSTTPSCARGFHTSSTQHDSVKDRAQSEVQFPSSLEPLYCVYVCGAASNHSTVCMTVVQPRNTLLCV